MDTAPLGYVHPVSKTPRRAISRTFLGVSDGIRTHDRLDHNQELYQLSYAHRAGIESSSAACAAEAAAPSEELIHFQLASRCGGAGDGCLKVVNPPAPRAIADAGPFDPSGAPFAPHGWSLRSPWRWRRSARLTSPRLNRSSEVSRRHGDRVRSHRTAFRHRLRASRTTRPARHPREGSSCPIPELTVAMKVGVPACAAGGEQRRAPRAKQFVTCWLRWALTAFV